MKETTVKDFITEALKDQPKDINIQGKHGSGKKIILDFSSRLYPETRK